MVLRKGTIEPIVVDLKDVLGNATTVTAATFDIVTDDDDETPTLVGGVPSVDGLQLSCLIDTTSMDTGGYKLYVQFTSDTETPRLLATRFAVEL